MLGIVNPGLVSVDEIKNKSTRQVHDCDKCGCSHGKRDCPAYGKDCYKCGGKNHFGKMCRSSKGSNKSESRCDSRKPSKANGKCSHKCKFHEVNEECHDDMNDLMNRSSHSFTIKIHRNLIANEPEKWPVMVSDVFVFIVLELEF